MADNRPAATIGATTHEPHLYLKPRGQILSPQVRVALQHLQGLVTGDGRDLHEIESLLEQAAGGFMAQVVETQPLDAGMLCRTFPGLRDR